MNMVRKGQIRGVEKGAVQKQIKFISEILEYSNPFNLQIYITFELIL
jgi:hypothetical protein